MTHVSRASHADSFLASIHRELEERQSRIDTKEELCGYLSREFGEPITLRGIRNEGLPMSGQETLFLEVGGCSIEWMDFPAGRLDRALYNALILPGSNPYPRQPTTSRPMHWAERQRRYQDLRALEDEMFAEIGFDSSGIDDEKNADPDIGSPHWRPTEYEARYMAMLAAAEAHDSLSSAELYRAYRANYFAGCIGAPLNARVVITWKLYGVDENEVFRSDERFRELFRKWITDRYLGAAYINVIERGAHVGLHSHFRCHVPDSMKQGFAVWLPQAVRTAVEKTQGELTSEALPRPYSYDGPDKAVPFTELLDRARRAAGTPAHALSASVRHSFDNRGDWSELAYTMKSLNEYEPTSENLRNLGYLLHAALRLPDRGDTTVPADPRRLKISRLLGPTSQKEWKNVLIEAGVDANNLACPIDKPVSSLCDLHLDKAELIYRTYGLSISILPSERKSAAKRNDPFAN